MKTNVEVNGKTITIELTDEQIKQIREAEKPKYPMSGGACGGCWNITINGDEYFSSVLRTTHQLTKETAAAFGALMELKVLCDKWNEIDGVVIDWADAGNKYTIYNYGGSLDKQTWAHLVCPIAFGKEKTRALFLEAFREKLEIAKPLL